MSRLVRVELARFLARRAVLFLLFAAFAIPTAIGIGVAWEHRPISAADQARAEQQAEREAQQPHVQEELARCSDRPGEYGVRGKDPDRIAELCEEMVVPQVEWYLYRQPLDLTEERDWGSGIAITMVVTLVLMLAGITFAGHDWATGSVTNQLLFEPRRTRVWAAKAITVTAVAATVGLVVHTAYWWGLHAAARAYDVPPARGVLLDSLQFGWRSALFATIAALGGYAITMLLRSTVGTLGLLFVLGFAGSLVLAVVGIEGAWNPATNLLALVRNGTVIMTQVVCQGAAETPEGCWGERTLTFTHGLTYYGVLLAVAITLSIWSFRKRDV